MNIALNNPFSLLTCIVAAEVKENGHQQGHQIPISISRLTNDEAPTEQNILIKNTSQSLLPFILIRK